MTVLLFFFSYPLYSLSLFPPPFAFLDGPCQDSLEFLRVPAFYNEISASAPPSVARLGMPIPDSPPPPPCWLLFLSSWHTTTVLADLRGHLLHQSQGRVSSACFRKRVLAAIAMNGAIPAPLNPVSMGLFSKMRHAFFPRFPLSLCSCGLPRFNQRLR